MATGVGPRARGALRVLLPQRARHPGSPALALLTGHAHAGAGAWREALSDYLHALRAAPGEPLAPLCIAAALACQASAKAGKARRAELTGQALAFAQDYARLRGDDEVGFCGGWSEAVCWGVG